MQNVPHHNHVGTGYRIREETSRLELQPRRQSVGFNILFKDRTHFRQVKSDAQQVLVLQQDLRQ